MKNKLNDLNLGEEAVITGYIKTDERYRQRLLSMGLTKGTRIKLLKLAPLGDPVEILVRGFKLSLRKDEAEILLLKGDNYE
jgi:ferrous iron transport protein A